ncbi:rhodanese-like domain-containing protein [Spirosoma fluminis]
MIKRWFHLFMLLALPAGSVKAQYVADKKFDDLLHGMLNKSVPAVTADELHQHQANALILDAREPGEYAVSHLKGAIPIGYKKLDLSALDNVPKNQPIMVYCSVGYRSQKITQKLADQGFTQVKNVYGGIFEWVNRGYPVVNAKGQTDSVHAYSPSWGQWLQRGQKVYK